MSRPSLNKGKYSEDALFIAKARYESARGIKAESACGTGYDGMNRPLHSEGKA
jgi:hypothetical protein